MTSTKEPGPSEEALEAAEKHIRSLVGQCPWPHELATWLDAFALKARLNLQAAAQALVNKLHEIHKDPQYEAVFTVAQLHRGPYTGPSYDKELANLQRQINGEKP